MSDFCVDSVVSNAAGSEEGIHSASKCVIRVIGVGGGGGNSLQHMINQSLNNVEFIAVNTDAQALNKSTAPLKVQIGVKLTNGLGAGCDPNKGRKAAEESKEDIKKLLQGSQMVFITAGMGGGTGTGAAPIISEIAKETGALTIAVVTKPFSFEGPRHQLNAAAGITELSKHVDSLVVIDNDKLLKNLGANISIINAFNEANDVLLNAVKGITDSITAEGYINLDFADVKTIMMCRGHAMIGNGVGQGANFVEDAVQRAIHSPLIDQVDIRSATGLLVNARVNHNFPIAKWEQINNEIQSYADEEADCKFGLSFDDTLAEDQIVITILITGIAGTEQQSAEAASIARSNAAMRRNASASMNNKSGTSDFFRQSQRPQGIGQAGVPQGMQQPPVQAMQQMQPMQPQHQPMDARMQAGMQRQQAMAANGAPNYGSVESKEFHLNEYTEEDPRWDVPSILRKKV